MVQRGKPPFVDSWALPGGHIELGEIVEDAVVREIKEETNLDIKIDKLFNVYSQPGRDPRGHYITIAYFYRASHQLSFKGGDEALTIELIPFTHEIINKSAFAFDHKEILMDAIERYG